MFFDVPRSQRVCGFLVRKLKKIKFYLEDCSVIRDQSTPWVINCGRPRILAPQSYENKFKYWKLEEGTFVFFFFFIRTEHLFLYVQLENPPMRTFFSFVTPHMFRLGHGVTSHVFEVSTSEANLGTRARHAHFK